MKKFSEPIADISQADLLDLLLYALKQAMSKGFRAYYHGKAELNTLLKVLQTRFGAGHWKTATAAAENLFDHRTFFLEAGGVMHHQLKA